MAKKKRESSPKAYIKAYKDAFESEAGKIVLADLIKRYRVLRRFPMTKNLEKDAFFCEAQRQVVLHILDMVNYDLSKIQEVQELYSMEVFNGQSTNIGTSAGNW